MKDQIRIVLSELRALFSKCVHKHAHVCSAPPAPDFLPTLLVTTISRMHLSLLDRFFGEVTDKEMKTSWWDAPVLVPSLTGPSRDFSEVKWGVSGAVCRKIDTSHCSGFLNRCWARSEDTEHWIGPICVLLLYQVAQLHVGLVSSFLSRLCEYFCISTQTSSSLPLQKSRVSAHKMISPNSLHSRLILSFSPNVLS